MTELPKVFQEWFKGKGWTPHPHQLEMLRAKEDRLLIAPTGGGKTLSGFLPALVELTLTPQQGLHTLYVSPLKALAADVARNLQEPITQMGLTIGIGTRTGDSTATERRRWRARPPNILLTTPESLALMLSWPEAPVMFADVKHVVLDEIHAIVESKRGDQLLLGVARLRTIAPDLQVSGLSATVEDPQALANLIGAKRIILADPGPQPDIAILPTQTPPPWAGQGGRYAIPDVLKAIAAAKTTLIFHNTRAQAELFFQALWLANHDNLPIALHHGALAKPARQKVEAAIVASHLRAVVATGTLDLGLDWGDVDQVIQIGGPRNIKRLVQRIGRAGHRYNTPSKARIVPANRFEVIECVAAIEAALEQDLDSTTRWVGALDVLIQHIQLCACAAPFKADDLYTEVRTAGPYATLSRADFDACLDCAATGGYVLRAYDRWQRLMQTKDLWHLRDPRAARLIRLNIGTIVEAEKLRVKRKGRGGADLGLIEESFAATLRPGDTFLLGGEVLAFEALRDLVVEVRPAKAKDPKITNFTGQSLPVSTELSQRMLAILSDPERRKALPEATAQWLALQEDFSRLPQTQDLLCEVFPHRKRWHLVIYGFAGRNAHQTLGLLVSQRMEEAGLDPTGFLALDHAVMISSLHQVEAPDAFLSPENLTQGFEDWLAGSSLMKRNFRAVATIAGLIQRSGLGARKSGRQVTFSSDILFDTLRRHDPDHILLRATRAEAQHGLVDFDRITQMLEDRPKIVVRHLPRVSPLAAPLVLQLGRVRLSGNHELAAAQKEAAALLALVGLPDD